MPSPWSQHSTAALRLQREQAGGWGLYQRLLVALRSAVGLAPPQPAARLKAAHACTAAKWP